VATSQRNAAAFLMGRCNIFTVNARASSRTKASNEHNCHKNESVHKTLISVLYRVVGFVLHSNSHSGCSVLVCTGGSRSTVKLGVVLLLLLLRAVVALLLLHSRCCSHVVAHCSLLLIDACCCCCCCCCFVLFAVHV